MSRRVAGLLCGLFWALAVFFVPASASSAATGLPAGSASSSLLAGSSWQRAGGLMPLVDCTLTPEDPLCASPSPDPSTTVDPSASPTSSPSPSPTATDSPTALSSSDPSASSAPLVTGSCSVDTPCVVTATVEEQTWVLLGVFLLATFGAAILVTLWGRE